MKKLQIIFFFLTGGALIISSCTKNEPVPSPEDFPMTITASILPFTDTKARIENANVKWEEGDKFGLFEREGALYKNSNIEFSLSNGAGNNTATFTGYASGNEGWSVKDKIFMAYYPYSKTQMMASELVFSTPVTQIQNVSDPEAHLITNNCMVSRSEISASSDPSQASIQFTPLLAKQDFVIVNNTSSSLTIGGVDFKSMVGDNIFYSKGKFSLRDMAFEYLPSNRCSQYTVNLSDSVTIAVGNSYRLSMMIFPALIPQNTGIILVVKNSRKNLELRSFITDESGMNYLSGNLYESTISLTEASFAQSEIVTLAGNQNSFIVKAPQYEGLTNQYLIPLTRVNAYWGPEYANVPTNIINGDTKWVAEIIWKDVDVSGDINLIELTESQSSGTGPLGHIGVSINHDAAEPYGNAVIGIRKADANFNPVGDYLWSWHIWVSDYDGQLHDYSGTNGYKLMDRNLGAKNNNKGDVGALGLLYQWGRKDPFIGASATSFPDDASAAYAPTTYNWPSPVPYSTGGTMSYAVQHPTTFITSEDGSTFNPMKSDWMQVPDSYLWSNSEKTIYDPCPKGYKVARRNSW
ncbi:MAG: hypothetical protein M0P27_10780, partial [Bacteroidales bacterium]|nr:hypothetical protein [Bacteroidales bacterium]